MDAGYAQVRRRAIPGVFRANFAGLAQVRLIQDGDRWVVPVVDIAEAIGYDRQALHQIINREPEMFEGFVKRNVDKLRASRGASRHNGRNPGRCQSSPGESQSIPHQR